MKRNVILFLVVVVLAALLCACVPNTPNTPNNPNDNPTPSLNQSTVSVCTPPDGVALFSGVSVKVENVALPLYAVKVNNVQKWTPNPTDTRSDSGVGYFNLTGKTQVSVSAPDLSSCTIRPLSAGVTATVANGVATFTLSSAGTYAVEPNGNPQQAIFLFVSTQEEQPQPTTSTVIRFGKGLHTSQNNNYINGNTVTVPSDTTVILEEGAVVRARFVANNARNITVCGKGIVDGSAFTRNASTGEVTVPLDFNYCSNVTFRDFSVLDPVGWCVNWYFCTDSTIDGVKIISSRSNGDGISLQSCKNITVQNCFLRTWDDSLVVKNYPQWSNRDNEGATQNILFSNCILWTDLAQSMEIGYETVGETMRDITFRNITVLHNFHKPVMSVHNGNNANVQNVLYDTVTVEDASMGRGDAGNNNQLCEFAVEFNSTWSTQHKVTALGKVNGVTVKNVTVLDGNAVIPIRVAGSLETRDGFFSTVHRVSDVTFENVWIRGKPLSASSVVKNQYAEFSVQSGEQPVLAQFVFSMSQQTLQTYTDTAVVSVN